MIKDNFFGSPNISRYTLFTLLFQMGMAISLAAMPIYFKNENAVSAYGVAYSVMAITGAFSFVYGLFVDRIGFSKALLFGVMLYGVALCMRVFTNPIIAVITAIMAGLGASVAILANRSWVLQISQTSNANTTQLTAMRSMLGNISILLGTALVSLAAYLFESIYFYLLILAGLLVFGSNYFAFQNYKIIKLEKTNKSSLQRENIFKSEKINFTIILFMFANMLSGVYTGLFKPYLILMFVDYGVSEHKSIFIYLLTTLVSILSGFYLLKYHHFMKNVPFSGFFIAMISLAFVFFAMFVGLRYNLGIWFLFFLVLSRSVFLSLSSSFEQVLEYELFNKATLAMALGLTQTSFLAGDALGSLVTSLWIDPKNIHDYAKICSYCSILVLFHMIILFILKKYKKI
ncbi:MFS transporter [Moraxella nasovis]|uniref:MFS transporter n=1 Tax=Moraxella nasovis TaxID=2904121 RepID=UPI001F60F65B|nr:MFS transporter [Moraxella nasovis]UNU73260.1 MFS transporter [Moraxella nasovis]